MPASAAARLYTPRILALAVELAEAPLSDDLPLHGEARSRSCGSTLAMGVSLGERGAVERIGVQVTACAIGQAAAALFVRHAGGRDARQLADDLAAMEAWVAGDGPQPTWPDIALLEPARAYPARHGAMLLPWKAASAALCKEAAES